MSLATAATPRTPSATRRRVIRQLERLGHKVTLDAFPEAA